MDMNNDYTHAGKGAKARQRLNMREIPRKIDRPKKEKPEYQRNLKPRDVAPATETIKITERGLKARIIRYTLALANVSEIAERLTNEGFGPRSKVLIAYVRNQALDVLRIAQEERLIDEDTLNKYRRRKAREQRERFNRRD